MRRTRSVAVALFMVGGVVVAPAAVAVGEHPPAPESAPTPTYSPDALQRAAVRPSPGVSASITLDKSMTRGRVDGRVYLLVAKKSDLKGDEPRDHIDVMDGIPLWGKNVDRWAPGTATTLQGGGLDPKGVVGYPMPSLNALPAGEYVVQAFFNRYETTRRSDGSRIKVHFPCGDGGDIWHSPGNLYSAPMTVGVDPRRGTRLSLRLTKTVTPAEPVPARGTCQQGNPALPS